MPIVLGGDDSGVLLLRRGSGRAPVDRQPREGHHPAGPLLPILSHIEGRKSAKLITNQNTDQHFFTVCVAFLADFFLLLGSGM